MTLVCQSPDDSSATIEVVHTAFFVRVPQILELNAFTSGNPFLGGQNYLETVQGRFFGP